VRENLASGGPVTLSAGIVASWARYDEALDEQGASITIVDQLAGALAPVAQTQRESPLAFITIRKLFGDLAENPRFVEAYLAALESLWEKGARDCGRAGCPLRLNAHTHP
jgi:mannitol 2-dehydrogenase